MVDALNRRRFLKVAGAAGLVSIVSNVGTVGSPVTAWATPGSASDTVLVSVSLRGAADGLNIVCPHGDGNYYRQRARYGLQPGEFRDLDGFFGLNNDFIDLAPLYDQQQLTIIQAVGLPQPERSHFEAQAIVDFGAGTTGWLQRAIGASAFASDRAGVSIGDRTNPQLSGPNSGTIINMIDQAAATGAGLAVIRPAIEALYSSPLVPALERDAVLDAFATMDEVAGVDDMSGFFPNTSEASALQEAARLISADFGVRAIAINSTGWDHHTSGRNRMRTRGIALSRALAAFAENLGDDWKRVVVVVSSEFGRTVQPNASGGTEHGWANTMFVLGDRLKARSGGSVLTPGGWPGLANADLHEGRDLVATTDFRSVYAELVQRHLGVNDLDLVFPGLDVTKVGLLPKTRVGDVDSSGSITNADVQALLQQNLRQQPSPVGDIDGDGDTDLRDALVLAQQLDDE